MSDVNYLDRFDDNYLGRLNSVATIYFYTALLVIADDNYSPSSFGFFALTAAATRQVDKTGLISWKANKYSVPLRWQQARVGVTEVDAELLISDLKSGEVIASHAVCSDKGRVIKNTNHYRDHAQRTADLEAAITAELGEDLSHALCQQLKQSEPKIYKDQLRATRDLLQRHAPVDQALIEQLAQRPGLTATRLRDYLEAAAAAARKICFCMAPVNLNSDFEGFGEEGGARYNPTRAASVYATSGAFSAKARRLLVRGRSRENIFP